MTSFVTLVNSLPQVARINVMRTMVHSGMSRTIGALRQDLRNKKRLVRELEMGLDTRNEQDDQRGVAYTINAMGFPTEMSAMEQAEMYYKLYREAKDDLLTLSTSRFDEPLELDGMLSFMSSGSQPLPEALLKALSEATKVDIRTLKSLHEIQERNDRDQFIEMLPEIKAAFAAFDSSYDGSIGGIFDELPIIVQHQFALKAIENLDKAKGKVLIRMMRSRRMSELGDIALFSDAMSSVEKWVADIETRHGSKFAEAIVRGVNLRVLEDVAPHATA